MAKKLDALRDNSIQELEAKLVELKTTLLKEKAKGASGTRAEKPAKIRNARRGIARTLTIINEKRRKAASKQAGKVGEINAGNKAKGVSA